MKTYRVLLIVAVVCVVVPTSKAGDPSDWVVVVADEPVAAGVRLGVPDVQIGGRYVGEDVAVEKDNIISTLIGVVNTFQKRNQLPPGPTEAQWGEAESLGFSREPAMTLRGWLHPTAEMLPAIVDADVWYTLEPDREGGYFVEGSIDLTSLANNGLFTVELGQMVFGIEDVPQEIQRRVIQLLLTSNRVDAETTLGLLRMDTGDNAGDIDIATTLKFGRGGFEFTSRGGGWWPNCWQGVKDTVNCYFDAFSDFVGAHESIEWELTCSVTGCTITIKGKVTGAEAQQFLQRVQACFNGE